MLTLILTLMVNILAFFSLNYHSLVYLMIFTFFLSLTNFGNPFITLWFQSTNVNFSMISLTIFVSTLMMMVGKHYSSIYAPQAITTLMSICILFFSTNNFILLYITFELSLIPTLMMIIKWGYQPERLQASYYLMMYTISASLPLMMMLVYMYMNNFSLYMNPQSPLCMYMNMQHMNYFISIMFILAFLVKLPVYGAHLWLPKAHVEAPISGSMILAGVLLKLGGYGLMKMMYILTNLSNMMYIVLSVSIWGALIVSFVCMTSIDMKKLIAYSSVIHMNLLIIGMISMSDIGTKGAVLMMISHGISSPGMFTMAHLNYQKALSRNLLLQKGFSQIQPVFMLTWFLLISANMAAPPSLNLASEIFISISILKISFFFSLLLAIITFMSASYNLYIFSAQLSNTNYLNPFKKSTSLEFLGALTQSLPSYFLILLLPLWS